MSSFETSSEQQSDTERPHSVDITRLRTIDPQITPERGLTEPIVVDRQRQFGPNQLAEAPPTPAWQRFLAQFRELVIGILIVAAVIAGFMGEWIDTAVILAIVLVNGVIGYLQEERASRALSALQKLSSPHAKVLRDGKLQLVPARELVPGDVIDLEAGDNIPADARLVSAFGLRVQESALTGESLPVEKDAEIVLAPETPLADRRNMVYMGTVTAAGKAVGIVTGTGMRTELGQIADLLQQSPSEPTPLQRRLAELGRILVVICLTIVVVIFSIQLFRGHGLLETLLISVSLAVAAVPEGLPAVVTLTLALGLQRMVQRNAIVRRLPSVETLGSVTVVCTDKTGTLTRNEMTVREIVIGPQHFAVTGAGYVPQGEFRRFNTHSDAPGESDSADVSKVRDEPVLPEQHAGLLALLTTAARCNNATVSPRSDDSTTWQVIGDPTEGALLVAALKAGIEGRTPDEHLLFEIPFDSERKTMSVVVQSADGTRTMHTKGAPEVILGKCVAEWRDGHSVPLTPERRREIALANTEMAGRAMRILGLARRRVADSDYEESGLEFLGLVGMIDPPREEARQAVQLCRQAGIRPVMITGDHPETALAIARELQIALPSDRVTTGRDLDQWSDDELNAQVDQLAVYARVSAEHKLRIVNSWKDRGQIVAMTGDGVNDAPAVKAADIGIAMGVAGTDVTKEASDMVLTDDNFASIVNAIEEGRGIFDNIQKVVHYLLACNTGEVLLMFFASLLGWPVPLLAIQILWINLVTDGLPALALGMEPPERDIMRRPPRPPLEPVITPQRGWRIFVSGLLFTTASGLGFWLIYQGDPAHLRRARTVAFCVMAFSQLFFGIASRSQSSTMPQLGFLTNPHLLGAIGISGLLQLAVVTMPFTQPVFEVATHLTASEWGLLLALSLAPVTLVEITKLVAAMFNQRAVT